MTDSSFTFAPSNAVDVTKERDWAAQLGMLDWDNTDIVFTKRTLLEFLKYAGITVDPNFTNIQKLPRYARFGKLSEEDASDVAATTTTSATSPEAAPASDFRPTRRVREPPGGTQHNIFQFAGDDDALANAPPKPSGSTDGVPQASSGAAPESANATTASEQPKSKKTTSSGVANLWDAPEEPEFKPTRRVRERPGGKDSISELF